MQNEDPLLHKLQDHTCESQNTSKLIEDNHSQQNF